MLKRVGWGPFRMPGERKRMERLDAKIAIKIGELAEEAEAERNRMDDVDDEVSDVVNKLVERDPDIYLTPSQLEDLSSWLRNSSPLPGFLDDVREDDEHDIEAVIEHSRKMGAAAQTLMRIYYDMPLGAHLEIGNHNLDVVRKAMDAYRQSVGSRVRVEGVRHRRRAVPPAQSRAGRREADSG